MAGASRSSAHRSSDHEPWIARVEALGGTRAMAWMIDRGHATAGPVTTTSKLNRPIRHAPENFRGHELR